MKIKAGRNCPLTDVEQSWIRRLVGAGYSMGMTARAVGRSEKTVQLFARQDKLTVADRRANQSTVRAIPDDIAAQAKKESALSRCIALGKKPDPKPVDRMVWKWAPSAFGGSLVPITLPKVYGVMPRPASGLRSIGGRMRSSYGEPV